VIANPLDIAVDQLSGPRLLERDRFEVVDRLIRFGQFVNVLAGIAAGSQGRVTSSKKRAAVASARRLFRRLFSDFAARGFRFASVSCFTIVR